jgi:ABC-type nitrate/sulfonate/bicarbonate transport system substrate-binding protein
MMTTLIRAVLFSVFAGVIAMCAPSLGFAQPLMKVRVGMVTVASQMALDIGQKKGFFANRGFDIDIRPLASGVQANQALAANQVDWSAGGVESSVIAASAKLPFKPYSMYAKGGDSLGVLVGKDSGIKTLHDLEGKRIAVATGTASAEGLSQILKSLGLPNDAVRRVNANFGTMGPMLVQGSVDAIVALEPFLTITQQAMGPKAILLTRLGKYVQGGGFFLISDSWAASNTGKINDAVEALWESEKFVRDNPKEAAAINAATLKTDPVIIEASVRWLSFDPLLDEFTVSSLEKTSDYLASENIMPSKVDVDAFLSSARSVEAELKKKRPDLLQ